MHAGFTIYKHVMLFINMLDRIDLSNAIIPYRYIEYQLIISTHRISMCHIDISNRFIDYQ